MDAVAAVRGLMGINKIDIAYNSKPVSGYLFKMAIL